MAQVSCFGDLLNVIFLFIFLPAYRFDFDSSDVKILKVK